MVRRSLEIARDNRAQGREVRWFSVGRRGGATLRFRRQTIDREYIGQTDRPKFSNAQEIATHVADLYVSGEVDQVVMVYNHFITALTQRLDVVELLPVPEEALGDEPVVQIQGAYIEEPDGREILAQLLPAYLEITIFRALLESTASSTAPA